MTTTQVLTSLWDWEPSVVMGCIALALGYVLLSRKELSSRAVVFLSGVALLLLALSSPLDALGDDYLLSAHVAQHFLLALVIPPLWLLGTPQSVALRILRVPFFARIEHLVSSLHVAWPLGVGTMLVWHAPRFFEAALASEPLHICQHLTFLIAGTIFWWPVLGPLRQRHLRTLPAVSYLFSACVACSVLGGIIAFGPTGLYASYLQPEDKLGILPLIRGGWGLNPANDQQLAGMLMWVPGCFVYLSAILVKVGEFYGARDEAEQRNVGLAVQGERMLR